MGAVDGDNVPVRHFGAVLSMEQWEAAADKLRGAGTNLDPSGNAVEFKAFANMASLFAK